MNIGVAYRQKNTLLKLSFPILFDQFRIEFIRLNRAKHFSRWRDCPVLLRKSTMFVERGFALRPPEGGTRAPPHRRAANSL